MADDVPDWAGPAASVPDWAHAEVPTSFVGSLEDIPHSAAEAGMGALKAGASNIASSFQRRPQNPDEGFLGGIGADIKSKISGAGKFWGGVGEIAGAPLAALYGGASAPVGYGLAKAEHGIGTLINPHAAAQDDPQAMYEQAKQDAAMALQVAKPRSGFVVPPVAAPVLAPEALANAKLAREFGFDLSKGQAARNLDDIRYEDLASRGAYGKPAQDVAAPFFEQQFSDIQAGGEGVGSTLARTQPTVSGPGEAATVANMELGDAAARTRQAQAALDANAERETAAARGIHQDQTRILNEAIQGGHLPIENPREAGEIVGHEVRTQAAAGRADYRNRYDEAFSLPGEFHAATFEGVGRRIQGALSLNDNPVIIDDVTTPVASRAIRDLDNISNLRIQNRADPFGQPNLENITAVDLRGVDQARKRLTAFYRAARSSGNAADARATGRLVDEFDNQVETAMSNGLFSGDPQALAALQAARASYASYARQYRPQQAGDDVGAAMRRIIDRQATPEEISNMIIGSGRVGNAGLPVRLADRLEGVLGANSDGWNAIRQGIWQKASQVRNAAGEIDPARSAGSIQQFAGSSLGRRMFSQQELNAMRAHAQGVRDLEQTIEQIPAVAQAQTARATYQRVFGGEGIGGAQQAIFRRIMEGTATPEETTQAVFGAVGSGNPGNVTRMLEAIRNIAGPDSDTMAAIRQGVWQKLTQNAIGKDQPGQQKVSQAINEFLNGRGATIARQLYSPAELALMKRYVDAVRLTIIPPRAATRSDTTVGLMSVLNKYGSAIAASLAGGAEAVLGHGVTGGLIGTAAGYGVGHLISKGVEAVKGIQSANKTAKQFDWLNHPQAPKVPVTRRIGSAAAVSNLANYGRPAQLPVPGMVGDSRQQMAAGRARGGGVNPANIDADPTEAQKEAGNYAKDHVRIHGLDVTIENAKGAERKGVDRNGKPWSVRMPAHYGYIKGTVGKDKDHVDVYLGPHKAAPRVFIIDQVDADSKRFDEHKVFIGFASKLQAISTYHKAFSDGRGGERLGQMTEMSVDEFKQWLERGDTTKALRYGQKSAA